MSLVSISQSDLSRILSENEFLHNRVIGLQQTCTMKEMLLRVYRRIPLDDDQFEKLKKDVDNAINMVNGWYNTNMRG